MPRFQVYMSDETLEQIKEIALKNNCSVSQAAGKAILDGLNKPSYPESMFEAKKTNALLSYVLGSVYDEGMLKSNTATVHSILDKIEDGVRKKLAEN